jgi:hypothetical protein
MDKVPEISIYGNSASYMTVNGIKLLTLRLDRPKYADFQIGRYIVIRYDGGGFDLGIVFSREVKPLKDYSPAELLLDGYLSVAEAAKDLKQFTGYEDVIVDTPMLGIGLTTESHLHAYLNEEKRQLLFDTSLNPAVRMSEFHDLFLPSYLWWALLKNEAVGKKLTVAKWHKLLSDHLHLFDQSWLKRVRTVDNSTEALYSRLRHKNIEEILKYESSQSSLYQSVVLCRPVSVKKEN